MPLVLSDPDCEASRAIRAVADQLAVRKVSLAGKPVTTDQKPSIGCNIKWKEQVSGAR